LDSLVYFIFHLIEKNVSRGKSSRISIGTSHLPMRESSGFNTSRVCVSIASQATFRRVFRLKLPPVFCSCLRAANQIASTTQRFSCGICLELVWFFNKTSHRISPVRFVATEPINS